MDTAGDLSPATSGTRPLLIGGGLAAVLAALWVLLTSLTGDTYHLAPTLVVAAPALVLRFEERPTGLAAPLILGLALGAAGWLTIVALGIEPTATVIENQWGGVAGEVLAAGIAGAIAAVWMLRSIARREGGSGA